METVSLSVNDLGNTGFGESLKHYRTIRITVHPVDDPPVLVIPTPASGYLELLEDTAGVIGEDCCGWVEEGELVRISGEPIQISDPDMKWPNHLALAGSKFNDLPFNGYSRWKANARQGTWSRYDLNTDGDSLPTARLVSRMAHQMR